MFIREGRRVMVVSAHTADFCSRAGGTIARLADAGSVVQVYDLTYGERCESQAAWARSPTPTLEGVKATRRAELEAAAAVVGAQIECLDWDDCPLVVGPERLQQLLELMRAFRPDLVLTHWGNDVLHPDHAEAARAAVWASRYTNRNDDGLAGEPLPLPEVVYFETTLGTAPASGFLPDLFVDITPVWERKQEALGKITTQPHLAPAYDIVGRYRAQEARFSAHMEGCTYAEAFCRLGAENGG